jgi:hypothetical protein
MWFKTRYTIPPALKITVTRKIAVVAFERRIGSITPPS